MENTRFDLRETMDQFQGLCLMITAERNVPIDIITDIRQTYKKIQDQLTKISGARQLVEGKYRQYYNRDSHREREIAEIAFLAKSLYLKFEGNRRPHDLLGQHLLLHLTLLSPFTLRHYTSDIASSIPTGLNIV